MFQSSHFEIPTCFSNVVLHEPRYTASDTCFSFDNYQLYSMSLISEAIRVGLT